MSNLSPDQFQQYKVDLGSRANNFAHDRRVEDTKVAEDLDGPRPKTADAPHGYYNQPSRSVRQQALPGMEMSVQDHLDALGRATGMRASIDSGSVSHRLMLHDHPGEGPFGGGVERAHLSYSNERPEEGVHDNGDTVGVGHPQAFHAGEIRMVRSHQPGMASALLETAERLAAEHGMAYPKHSWDRTNAGVRWSQKQMKKRGEQVW
jgi:hypothetical protein